MTDNAVCRWSEDGDGGPYTTSCGGYFQVTEGTPTDNEMKFCCYCGKPLAEARYVEDEDDR